jgi:hypothetical protein
MLYAMADGVGWAEIMYTGISARGIDLERKKNKNPYMGLFFVVFMIWGYFFILNLFVGAVISTYNRQKENLGKVFLLSGK